MIDFTIFTNPNDLQSTGFIEIGPGKYNHTHWNQGFIFIWDDAFWYAEGIIMRHMPTYDHFEMNDIDSETGGKIIEDWLSISDCPNDQLVHRLNLSAVFRDPNNAFVHASPPEVKNMIRTLGITCKPWNDSNNGFCVLGM